METWLNRSVPEGRQAPWVHTAEGPDDMPGALCGRCALLQRAPGDDSARRAPHAAHVKASTFGCSLSIPITDGKLNLGTWQARGRGAACASSRTPP